MACATAGSRPRWRAPRRQAAGPAVSSIARPAHSPPILVPVAPITWMVISRDVSHAVRVADQPVVFAALILDVDTGLIRGLSVAEDVRSALAQAIENALNKPAGTLPPGRPQRVLAAAGLGDLVANELGRRPGLNLIPPIDEIAPGTEAEDIFDSFVGSMAGRRQPIDPPSSADWKVLFDQVQAYAEATPWRRWADDIDFVVDVVLDGERRRVKAVVMGNAGIQPGLAIFPGDVVQADLEHWDPAAPRPYEAETLACTLDDPDDVPVEFRARAIRYGWRQTAPLVPSFLGVDEDGGREISTADARLFAVVTAAVVAHDRRHRRPSPRSSTPTEGEVAIPDSSSARYSVLHQDRPD
jgi:hypothetical protein